MQLLLVPGDLSVARLRQAARIAIALNMSFIRKQNPGAGGLHVDRLVHSAQRQSIQFELDVGLRSNGFVEGVVEFDFHFVEEDGEDATLEPTVLSPARTSTNAISDNDAWSTFG